MNIRNLTLAGVAVALASCTPIGNAAPPRLDHEEGNAAPVYRPMLVVPLPELDDGAAGRPLQSLQARNTPIGDVLLALFRDSDINLIVAPDVQARECTFDIKHSTVEQAFEALLQSTDLGYEWDGDFLRVSGRVKDTLYVDLMTGGDTTAAAGNGGSGSSQPTGGSASNGASAGTEFWSSLEQMLPKVLGDDATTVINRTASTVHVEGKPSGIARLREVIDTTARRVNRQVSLEARILEVRLGDKFDLGVNWSLLPGLFHTNNTGLGQGGGVVSQVASSGGTALTFGVLDSGNFSVFVDALQNQGQVRVLSSPRVSTMNNQLAQIGVTDQVPYITREVIDDQGVARTEYGVEFVDTGVTLNVRPMIGEDGILTVSITPQVREQTGTVVTPDGFVEVPVVSERSATTTVRVSDGQVIAIGGLRSTRKEEQRTGVPFLMDVPLLGQLFSNTVQSRTEVELMILLSPRVLDDTWIQEEVRRGSHRLVQLRRGFRPNPIDLEETRSEDWAGGSLQGASVAAVGPGERTPETVPHAPGEGGLTVTRHGLAGHWLRRAQTSLADGAPRQAIADLERALTLDPRQLSGLVACGVLVSRQGDVPRARTLLDRALAIGPDDGVALTARGALELAHGSPHAARRYFERAHALAKSAVTAANLGAALIELGELQAARELLHGAAGGAAPPELFANLAYAELAGGAIDDARADLVKSLAAGVDAGNPRIVALKKLIDQATHAVAESTAARVPPAGG
ncbi:MAG: hypothetical protein U1E73_13065 [Planctomycetota bacterium]